MRKPLLFLTALFGLAIGLTLIGLKSFAVIGLCLTVLLAEAESRGHGRTVRRVLAGAGLVAVLAGAGLVLSGDGKGQVAVLTGLVMLATAHFLPEIRIGRNA